MVFPSPSTTFETRLGTEVSSIDLQRKSVLTSAGETACYDRLLMTTGSRARRLELPEGDARSVCYLRTIDDAVSLRSRLVPSSRLLVIGGGWIGLEVAASARQRSVEVVLVEAASRLCSRTSPSELSEYLYRLHEENGVDIRLQTSVIALQKRDDETQARLSNGQKLVVDAVVAGIGVQPNVEVAEAAGLKVGNGIVVDESCQTSDPFVFAAGDVANSPDATGRRIRLESWANAQNQAIAAAKNLLGARYRIRTCRGSGPINTASTYSYSGMILRMAKWSRGATRTGTNSATCVLTTR
ncbi:NAD(P)/FAD-dependent oxidoreductase [Pseudorhodoplanes sp.]|uniref:NAD(P)/FAD-dependent oxidoreductase n=1 Tax=Pseudorhodoplanes sp. TaxID=1934341 RepID=UPI003D0DD40D